MNSTLGQLDLLPSGAPRFPRARRTDAISSHQAAAVMESTGAGEAQMQRVLAGPRRFPGSTSHELSRSIDMDRYAIARRLPELERRCLVRKAEPAAHTVPCQVSGKKVCRWYP